MLDRYVSYSKGTNVSSFNGLFCHQLGPCAAPIPNCLRLHFIVEIVSAALLSSKSPDVQVQRCVDTKTQKKGSMG